MVNPNRPVAPSRRVERVNPITSTLVITEQGVAEMDDWSDLPVTLFIVTVPDYFLTPIAGDSDESEIVPELLVRAILVVGYPKVPIDSSWFIDLESNRPTEPNWELAKTIRIPLTYAARIPIYVPASTLYIVYPECSYLLNPNTFRTGSFSVECQLDESGYAMPLKLIQSSMTEAHEYSLFNFHPVNPFRVGCQLFREWSEGDLPTVLGSESHLQIPQEFQCVRSYFGLSEPLDELVVEIINV